MNIKTIEIRNGKKSTWKIKDKLKKNGFMFVRTGKYSGYWILETTDMQKVRHWKRYGYIGYECRIYEAALHERSDTYRKNYFAQNPPDILNRYHCAYCGKLLPKDSLVIDHLIPVQKVKSSGFWQKVLKVTGIENVNNPKNLVGSCNRCNSKKGSKTSFWILRGIIGHNYSTWLCIKFVLLLLLLLVGSHLYKEIQQFVSVFLP